MLSEASDDSEPLEEAPSALLRDFLSGVRKHLWDEAQFQGKLCLKLKVAANGLERGSLASFVADSRGRERSMRMLEKRLLLILEERKEIH